MKLFIYGNPADCTVLLSKQIERDGKDHGVECHTKFILPNRWHYPLFDETDFHKLKNSDAIVTFGTWGSNHPSRQWNQENASRNKQGLKDLVNQFAEKMAKGFDKPHIVTETGTYSRLRANYAFPTSKGRPRYYRMGLNHWVYGKAQWLDKKYFDFDRHTQFKDQFEINYEVSVPRTHAWQNNTTKNGKIFIIPGLEHDPTSTVRPDLWVKETINELRNHTKRKIVIKSHPLSGIDFVGIADEYQSVSVAKPGRLQDFYDQMYCAVIDNSTSVFELVDYGIPVFCDRFSFGAGLGNIDLSHINKIKYASESQYTNWEVAMSHTEFSVSEWNSPEIYTYIKKLINYRK